MADILARQRMYSIADNATLGAAAGGLAYLLWRVAKRSLATTTATNEDKHPEAKAEVEAKVEALAKARAEAEAKAKAEAEALVKAEAEAAVAAASTGDASVAAVDLAPAAAARWTVHTSASGPNSGRKYYHDHVLKKSYWTKPDDFDGPAPQASDPATRASNPAPRASDLAPHNNAKTKHIAGGEVAPPKPAPPKPAKPSVEGVAEEAEGYKLHLANRSNSSTGYKGVSTLPNGRFIAIYYDSALKKNVCLGTYNTAVEAAVAYAKHIAGDEDLCDSWSNRASNPAPKTTSPMQRIAAIVSMVSNAVVGIFLASTGAGLGSVPFLVAASAAAGVCCLPERSSTSQLARSVLWLIGRMKVGALLFAPVIGLAAGYLDPPQLHPAAVLVLIVFIPILLMYSLPWIAAFLVIVVADLYAA